MTPFFKNSDQPWEDIGGGIKRKIIHYTDDVMVVRVCFDKGAVGPPHSHIHVQIGYIESGSFKAEVDGEKCILEAGDAFLADRHKKHGAVALEENSTIT